MSKHKQRAQADEKRYEEEHNALMDDDFEVSTKKKINWDSISDQYLSNNDRLNLRQLQGIDTELLAPDADIKAIFDDEDQSISVANSFIKVLELRSPEQLTYILLLLSRILRNDDRRGKIFLKLQKKTNKRIISSFSRVWLRDDISSSFCKGNAAISAAIILRWSNNNNNNKNDYKSLCSFILREFTKCRNDQLISPLLALKGIILNLYFLNIFLFEGGIDKLCNIIFENDNHRQVIYLTIYNLWALTFTFKNKLNKNEKILLKILLNGLLIDKLIKFIKNKLSTKITRVILGLFENLLNFENFNEMVVLFGLFPILQQMEENEEKIDDFELKCSVKNLLNNLESSVKILSSFERYSQEIGSEKLLWGPCHNESFWKKYSNKLENDNYKLIRCLIKLLDSADPETVAVACYDIGEWSRFYQEGSAKSVIEKLNGKYKLMKLIDHYDNDVKQNALNAVQKVLVKNWKHSHTHSHTNSILNKND